MLALTDTSITEMALGAMLLTAKLGAPILLTAMAIGVFIGIDLVFHGWAWVILGLTVRPMTASLAAAA